MPWRLDSSSRSDDIVAAVHRLIAEGGVPAVSYRSIARRLGVSHSTLHDHYPDLRHLYRVVAHGLGQHRIAALTDDVRIAGPVGLLPRTPDELRDSVVWLALRQLCRTEPTLCATVAQVREHERALITGCLVDRGHEEAGAPRLSLALHALVEGLESELTVLEPSLSVDQASQLLDSTVDRLLLVSPTDAA